MSAAHWTRREFVTAACAAGVSSALAAPAPKGSRSLAGETGITMGTFGTHLKGGSGLTLLDIPRLLRDELDMRIIDLMTATVPSLEPAYLDKLRAAAESAGCIFTNLKMNQYELDLSSPDDNTRNHAIDEYRRTMTAAARLGVRWVRPVSGRKAENAGRLATSYRKLIDHGAPLGITILIENVGWIKDDPDVIPKIIAATGRGLRAQPDTGNWNDAVRYDGLAKAFPLAASCDFKAWDLGPDGSHAKYDLERCFQIGWKAGFRGPWCLEHFNETLPGLKRGLGVLRDQLRGWMKAAKAP